TESIDELKFSWLKGSWRRITYFAMKGPSFLRSPTLISPQIYTYKPPRSQQATVQTVTPPGPQASAWKPFPQAQPKMGTTTGGRKNFCVMYHNNDHDRNWAEWITWLLEEDDLNIIMPEWDFRAGYNVD